MNVVTDVLQALILFIAITYLVTEVLKRLIEEVMRQIGRPGFSLGGGSIVIAVVLGIAQAYFWWLTVLPDPRRPGGEWFAIIVSGFLIAGAASGVYSWFLNLGEWLGMISSEKAKSP